MYCDIDKKSNIILSAIYLFIVYLMMLLVTLNI
jgi:hypothetical protein